MQHNDAPIVIAELRINLGKLKYRLYWMRCIVHCGTHGAVRCHVQRCNGAASGVHEPLDLSQNDTVGVFMFLLPALLK